LAAGQPRVFPNPTSGMVTIDLGQTATVQGTIRIFNSIGVVSRTLAVAQRQRSLQLNVSDLAEGTYIINISAGKVIATLKLVKVSN